MKFKLKMVNLYTIAEDTVTEDEETKSNAEDTNSKIEKMYQRVKLKVWRKKCILQNL